MDLNQAHAYIQQEVNLKCKEPRYFIPREQDMKEFITLFGMICTRVNTDKQVDFTKNKIVKEYKEIDDKCYIKTQFGNAVFYRADEAIGKENAIQFIKPRQCHANCGTACLIMNKLDPTLIPKVVTGIVHPHHYSHPYLHSVLYCRGVEDGELLIDFNYNIAMSMDLFKKFYDFEVLSETSPNEIMELFEWEKKCGEYLSKNKKKIGYHGITYSLLSINGMIEYLKDVVDGKREDDFPFITNKEHKKAIRKLNRKYKNR